MKNKLIVIGICVCFCFQVYIVFSNIAQTKQRKEMLAAVHEKAEQGKMLEQKKIYETSYSSSYINEDKNISYAIEYMKKQVEDLYNTGKFNNDQRDLAMNIFERKKELLFDPQQLEKRINSLPIDLNQESAVSVLKRLNIVCESLKYKRVAYPNDFKELTGLVQGSPIFSQLGDNAKAGYEFFYNLTDKGYNIWAKPLIQGITGVNSYYLDQTGVMRFTYDGLNPTAESDAYYYSPFFDKHDPKVYFENIALKKGYELTVGTARGGYIDAFYKEYRVNIVKNQNNLSQLVEDYKLFAEQEIELFGSIIVSIAEQGQSHKMFEFKLGYNYAKAGINGYLQVEGIPELSGDILIKIVMFEY